MGPNGRMNMGDYVMTDREYLRRTPRNELTTRRI